MRIHLKGKVKIIFSIAVVLLIDGAVYIFFGLLLMNYDDFYDKTKGEYWSWSSMNTSEKLTIIGLQFWNLINIIALIYLLYHIYKWMKSRTQSPQQN